MSVYKSEKPEYLERSLQSIWDDQICKPNKIILVQDGPVGIDLTEVLDRWIAKLGDIITLIVNEVNIGLTKSLNKGITAIDTDYIARMDSDDVSRPDRFAVQSEFLDTHKDVAVIGAYIQEFSDICENLGVRKFPLDTDGAKKLIYKANPLAHPAVMMRKSMFDDGISYDENYRTSQDLALWFDILTKVIMWQILIKFFLILGETILFISVDQIGRIVILNLKFTKKEYINYLEFLLINRYFQ